MPKVTQPTRVRARLEPRSDINDGTLPSHDLGKKPPVGETVLALPWMPGLRGRSQWVVPALSLGGDGGTGGLGCPYLPWLTSRFQPWD